VFTLKVDMRAINEADAVGKRMRSFDAALEVDALVDSRPGDVRVKLSDKGLDGVICLPLDGAGCDPISGEEGHRKTHERCHIAALLRVPCVHGLAYR